MREAGRPRLGRRAPSSIFFDLLGHSDFVQSIESPCPCRQEDLPLSMAERLITCGRQPGVSAHGRAGGSFSWLSN